MFGWNLICCRDSLETTQNHIESCVRSFVSGKSLASGKFVSEIHHFELWHHRVLRTTAESCHVHWIMATVVWKQPYSSRRSMPYCCVAGGCSRTSDDGVLIHKFPTDTLLASKLSKAIRVHRADWTGLSSSSRLCSLHFTSDCDFMRKKMCLEDKRLTWKKAPSLPCSLQEGHQC